MLKVGIYLPVYGGWLSGKGSAEQEDPPTYSYIRQVAVEAERVGIDSLWIPDHMLNPIKGNTAPSLEAWSVAVAIAEVTQKVIIAHTALCEAFRYPAVLAKQAATLSQISNGRFWFSIGAGWFREEYNSYGLPFYSHDERVDRAREAIQIIKKLWEEDNVFFNGNYYQVSDGILQPKPDPAPPVWYAGMSKASRDLVCEEADGWIMSDRCKLQEVEHNISSMCKCLREKGKNRIEFAIPKLTFIRDTEDEAKTDVHKIAGANRANFERILETGLAGSPHRVAKKIKKFGNAGINHILLKLTPTLKELQNVKKVLDIL